MTLLRHYANWALAHSKQTLNLDTMQRKGHKHRFLKLPEAVNQHPCRGHLRDIKNSLINRLQLKFTLWLWCEVVC